MELDRLDVSLTFRFASITVDIPNAGLSSIHVTLLYVSSKRLRTLHHNRPYLYYTIGCKESQEPYDSIKP